MKDLQSNLKKLEEYKVTIVAISPETENEVRKTKAKNSFSFHLASDKDGETLRKLGLTFKVDDQVAKEYRSLGINLAESQENSKQELPVPATYIIGQDMKVKYGYVDAEYTKRPGFEDIIKTLGTLK